MSSSETEALDMIENKIKELEKTVYGEKNSPTENFNPVSDSLLQANSLMVAALSGRERIASVFKRLNELDNYLTPGFEDNFTDVSSKLNVILAMEEEFKSNLEILKKIEESKKVLDGTELHDLGKLQVELNKLNDSQTEKREKLGEITNEVQNLSNKFNDICLEMSKSFVCLNDAITKLEQEKLPKKKQNF